MATRYRHDPGAAFGEDQIFVFGVDSDSWEPGQKATLLSSRVPRDAMLLAMSKDMDSDDFDVRSSMMRRLVLTAVVQLRVVNLPLNLFLESFKLHGQSVFSSAVQLIALFKTSITSMQRCRA